MTYLKVSGRSLMVSVELEDELEELELEADLGSDVGLVGSAEVGLVFFLKVSKFMVVGGFLLFSLRDLTFWNSSSYSIEEVLDSLSEGSMVMHRIFLIWGETGARLWRAHDA